MNKQMTRWFDMWCDSIPDGNTQSLYHFYKKPSQRKIAVYASICRKQCNVRILTATCHFFTVGYMSKQVSTDTYSFVVKTGRHTYTESVSLDTLHAKGLDVLMCRDMPLVMPLDRG